VGISCWKIKCCGPSQQGPTCKFDRHYCYCCYSCRATCPVSSYEAHGEKKSQKQFSYPPPPLLEGKEKTYDFINSLKTAYDSDAQLPALQKQGKVSLTGDLYYHKEQLYVPSSLRLRCLEEMHDAPYSGHKGTAKDHFRDYKSLLVARHYFGYNQTCQELPDVSTQQSLHTEACWSAAATCGSKRQMDGSHNGLHHRITLHTPWV